MTGGAGFLPSTVWYGCCFTCFMFFARDVSVCAMLVGITPHEILCSIPKSHAENVI